MKNKCTNTCEKPNDECKNTYLENDCFVKPLYEL